MQQSNFYIRAYPRGESTMQEDPWFNTCSTFAAFALKISFKDVGPGKDGARFGSEAADDEALDKQRFGLRPIDSSLDIQRLLAIAAPPGFLREQLVRKLCPKYKTILGQNAYVALSIGHPANPKTLICHQIKKTCFVPQTRKFWDFLKTFIGNRQLRSGGDNDSRFDTHEYNYRCSKHFKSTQNYKKHFEILEIYTT